MSITDSFPIHFGSFEDQKNALCFHQSAVYIPKINLPERDGQAEFLSPVAQFKPGLATSLPLILPLHPLLPPSVLSLQITRSGGRNFVQ